ncbi:MAG TPA: DUF2179 domain-containing protein [Desulfitobacterium dehalogenans]|uniref:UPF0316 protein GX523_15855 n=1 Tax=Desulfitobacterium dehalogenans TaxID=36854 RepID=A0A7C6Z662_9FIRM|nr:DUF2179 domain-containing protein [Desulfitobacterium dehalogenans]
MGPAFQFVLIIIAINITYVTLTTIRFILMIKGMRIYASLLSVIEVFIYIMGLSIILDNLDSYWNIAAYCFGYGMGVYLGSRIEERLALGYIMAQVIVECEYQGLAEALRNAGFGVTSWLAEGKSGPRMVMMVLAKRNRQKELLKLIDKLCANAFVIFEEPKNFRGGFWANKVLH